MGKQLLIQRAKEGNVMTAVRYGFCGANALLLARPAPRHAEGDAAMGKA